MAACTCKDKDNDKKTNDDNLNIAHNHLQLNTEIGLTETPKGLTPREIYDYYNFSSRDGGRGKTIAIVDAFYYPNAEEDLRQFSREFSLPMPEFEVVYPQGTPEKNTSWILEAALDMEWAHAMAPCAKIMLVLAVNNGLDNLFDAVDYAVERGADIVSMSWGGPESSGINRDERYFRDKRAIFVASAGDKGGITIYPSSSEYVVSVGGTAINTNKFGHLVSETAWSGSGGGPSKYIPMPSWQKRFGLERLAGLYRATPDVAFDADPYTGVSVYYTEPKTQKSNWGVVGGTSVGAPSWAGIIASVFTEYKTTAEVSAKLYDLAGGTRYTNYRGCFHDITTGSAGDHHALIGYDFITGLGAPNIGRIRRALERRKREEQCNEG